MQLVVKALTASDFVLLVLLFFVILFILPRWVPLIMDIK